MATLIGGLTPREHFHLHGSLPTDAVEQLLDQAEIFSDFVEIVTEIAPDLSAQAYSNPDAYDLDLVRALLKILREIK
jgi:hypothetical protein